MLKRMLYAILSWGQKIQAFRNPQTTTFDPLVDLGALYIIVSTSSIVKSLSQEFEYLTPS